MDNYDIARQKLERAFAEAQAAVAAGEPLTVRHKAALQNKGPTADVIAFQISEGVKALGLDRYLFKAKQGARLADHDSVMVTYASVPKGSPEIDALNAKTNPMWHITEAKGYFWWLDGPSPEKATIEMFRGDIRKAKKYDKASIVKFRAKTDSPQKIVRYLLDFIAKNRECFVP